VIVVQQLKFEVVSRYYTFRNVFPAIFQFRICISWIVTISKTNIHLDASLTGIYLFALRDNWKSYLYLIMIMRTSVIHADLISTF
jgi:hypothetical protein